MCVMIFKMRILAEAQLWLTFLIKNTAQQEELVFFLSPAYLSQVRLGPSLLTCYVGYSHLALLCL